MKYDFAIITPTHNRVNTLKSSILSVMKQRDVKVLHIIVHDTNSEGTEEVIRQAEKYCAVGYKIVYVKRKPQKNEDPSAAHSINYAMSLLFNPEFRQLNDISSINAIGILHDDDLLAPESLSYAISKFNNSPELKLIVGQELFFYISNSSFDIRYFPTKISKKRFIVRALTLYAPYHAFFISYQYLNSIIGSNTKRNYLYDSTLSWGDDRDVLVYIAKNVYDWKQEVLLSNKIFYLYNNDIDDDRISNFLDSKFIQQQYEYICDKNLLSYNEAIIEKIKKDLKYEYKIPSILNLYNFRRRIAKRWFIESKKFSPKEFEHVLYWYNYTEKYLEWLHMHKIERFDLSYYKSFYKKYFMRCVSQHLLDQIKIN